MESDKRTSTNSPPRLVTFCETFFLTFLHLLSTVAYVFLLFTFVIFNVKVSNSIIYIREYCFENKINVFFRMTTVCHG